MSFTAEHCIPAAHRAKYGSHPSTANNQDTVKIVKEEAVFSETDPPLILFPPRDTSKNKTNILRSKLEAVAKH